MRIYILHFLSPKLRLECIELIFPLIKWVISCKALANSCCSAIYIEQLT